MRIRQLGISGIKGQMKRKLSSSIREKKGKKEKKGGMNERWQLSGERERERDREREREKWEEWNGKWVIYIYNNRWSREKIQLDFNWILNFAPLVITKTQKKIN